MRQMKIVSVLVAWMALIGTADSATVKVATYNIWFLKQTSRTFGPTVSAA